MSARAGGDPVSAAGPSRSGAGVLVIGAGLVGTACAWLLCRRGHAVRLIDARGAREAPAADDPRRSCGSEAALGVLMAGVSQRSRGRAWRLRQQSLLLWQRWRQELSERGRPLPWRPGLLLLAASDSELMQQQALLRDPHRIPGNLERLDRDQLERLWPPLPRAALGGLLSHADGQLDPIATLQALRADAEAAGLEHHRGWVERLERGAGGWQVLLGSGERLSAGRVVISAGLGSTALIPPGLALIPPPAPLEPVLGQALELTLAPQDRNEAGAAGEPSALNWPAAVVWRGINLIPRPAAAAAEPGLWLGATLEPGCTASAPALARLRHLAGDAPDWLLRARERRRWQGLRARPAGQPAPLLQDLGDGLLLAAGHYRNGVLLAPASAAWICARLEADRDML
ncbi:MAG: FAD-dependent oxidoreductase [Synechococcus sp.]|nr:FAD-dependent oxidoreductase [Synechococcus sp.]